MAEPPDGPIPGPKLQGLKYLDKFLPLFDRLHDVGCRRDRARNRKLHFDHYCALILLFLLNPVLRSFRALQAASLLEQVRRKVGCPRTSLGSLSEAVEILEPHRLEAIIAELWAEAPPSRGVGKDYVRRVLTAVDGSVVKTLASLAEAAYLRDRNGHSHCGWRFHTHFEIDRQLPVRIEVTSALNGGKTDEKQVLRRSLAAGSLLRDGPLVRRVRPLERDRRGRQQLRLPHPRQQQPRCGRRGAAGVGGGATGGGAPRHRGQAGDLAQGRGEARTIRSG